MQTIFLAAAVLAVTAGAAQAQFVSLEPDHFTNSAVLNLAVPGVRLVTAQSNTVPIPFDVTARTQTFPFQPPTGTNVFAHVGVPFFYTDRKLRMDFDGRIAFLRIDFMGGNSLGTERGRLDAFDADNQLVATYLTAPLGGGEVETMTITRHEADIAWAVAYTEFGEGSFGRLDNLVFSKPVPLGGLTPSELDVTPVPMVHLRGISGRTYRLEYTPRLAHTNSWKPIATLQLTNNAQFFYDLSGVGQPARIYRMVELP